MCGRFTLTASKEQLSQFFETPLTDFNTPSYNIAPSQKVPVVYYDEEIEKRQMITAEWGLVPAWAKEPLAQTSRFINARAETVLEKPSFQKPFLTQRCLIPASGFYEWAPASQSKNPRQPYYFYESRKSLFSFAGLWEMVNIRERQQMFLSFTLITTDANELMKPYHDRMPVILNPQDYQKWLGEEPVSEKELQDLLESCDNDFLKCHPVSRAVNSPYHNKPDCIEPLEGSDKETLQDFQKIAPEILNHEGN